MCGSTNRRHQLVRSAIPLLLACSQFLRAGTIVDIGSLNGVYGPAIQATQFVQQSWTELQTYTDVTVSVPMYSNTPNSPFDITAYLTSDAAPDVPIAFAAYSGVTASDAASPVSLFTGLTLGPGTYNITLAGEDEGFQSGAIWLDGPATPVFVDSEVTLAPSRFCGPLSQCNSDDPPESAFTQFPPGAICCLNTLDFTVTGSTVPEPATRATVWLGMMIFVLLTRKATFTSLHSEPMKGARSLSRRSSSESIEFL